MQKKSKKKMHPSYIISLVFFLLTAASALLFGNSSTVTVVLLCVAIMFWLDRPLTAIKNFFGGLREGVELELEIQRLRQEQELRELRGQAND